MSGPAPDAEDEMSRIPAPQLRRGLRGLRALATRPVELVESTRWLLFALALLSLVLTLPGAIAAGGHPLLLAGAGAGIVLAWTVRYRSQAASAQWDGVDVVAMAVLAAACPLPAMAFTAAFPGVWYRSVYGRTRDVTGYALALSVALALVAAGVASPWRSPSADPLHVLGTLPVLLITVVGARHLTLSLFEREHTRGRDTALLSLGTGLLGLTDLMEIRLQGWQATSEICRMTPDLRALVVVDDGDGGPLRVAGQAGRFSHEVTTLPREVLAAGAPINSTELVPRTEPLARATGFAHEWLCMPLPGSPGRWMLLGAPEAVPAEALTAIQSMNNQVALAMRTSRAYRELEEQARTDALTGLPNRATFAAALSEAGELADPRTWVVFIDLDDFKVVNDSLGHAAGDELLQHLATRISRTVRAGDLCARLGGDEFGVLLRELDEPEVRQIGQRLVELLSAPVTVRGRLAQVGASIGVSVFEAGVPGIDVVRRADLAMYAAKSAGRNRLQLFDPGLLDQDQSAALVLELRAALDENRFVVHYQPIVATADERCAAVEALVRWQHPTRGLLGPGEFLEAAERGGVLIPLGEWVLRQACAEAAGWHDDGRPVAVHVNTSPSQLAHPHFVSAVRDCLQAYAMAPKQLIIEITESTVLDAPAVRATLDVLSALGVGLAVDDFGTGYSALTTLRTLPVDIVKIDKSFVAGAATQVADQAVLEAIAQMADRLGLETVAEGVEDADQQRFVEEAGIGAVQGYLHLRPVPAAELTAWLTDRSRLRRVPAVAG